MPFQATGVKVLTAMPAVLLADDMGLGKTVQAVAAIDQLHQQGEVERVLVVAPASLLSHWRRTLHQFTPQLSAITVRGPAGERAWQWSAAKVVHIVGYETLRNDLGVARRQPWDLVVADEAQRIKNRDTGVSRACKALPRTRAWALTGTPLENRVDDLASVLEFARPNPGGTRLPSLQPGMSLLMLHQELQLRRRKQEVLTELPPRTDIRLQIELTTAQRRSYEKTLDQGRRQIIAEGEKATVLSVFTVLTRLKQVCNFDPETGQSSKLVDVSERLAQLDTAGHRALVFSQFTSDTFGAERIASGLARFSPLTFTGALGFNERDRVIEQFRNDRRHRALVLSLRAGGNGLNLQTASYVFHFDRWWNPAVENQASDRAHRLGQTNAVTVYAYTTIGTVEERIEEILAEKRALFAHLVDGVSLDPARILTPEEVFGLLDLRAPQRLRRSRELPAADIGEMLAGQLSEWGWSLAAGDDFDDGPAWTATRTDEIGLEEKAWVYLRDEASPGEVAELRSRAPQEVEVLVVTLGRISEELAEAASKSGVTVLEAFSLLGRR